jgi:membrane peptidoglycan carboxypeptidase
MPTSVAHIIRRRRNRKQRQKDQRQRTQRWGGLVWGILLGGLALPLVLGLSLAGWLYGRVVSVMPSAAETIYRDPTLGTTELYDRSGQTLLFSISDPLGEARTWLPLETLPEDILKATLLMEDHDFLETTRFSAFETLGALWQYMLGGSVPSDQSITGRLARNALLPIAKARSGLDDKLLEIVLVAELNRRYTPRALLEWHLNTNAYGNDAYGIEAAAQVYLGKTATALTLDEIALLAPIPLSVQYNPFDNENAARGRQADLLRAMLARNAIPREAYEAVASRFTPLRADLLQLPLRAPEFSLYARTQARDILNRLGMDGAQLLSRGGLRITTTLDMGLYEQSVCLMQAHTARLAGASAPAPCDALPYLETPFGNDTRTPPNDPAIVIMDVPTAELLSLAGNATTYAHQPAATLYPFVYLEGFRGGEFTPASMVFDIPQQFPGAADGLIYAPQNRDRQFRGVVSARASLAAGLLPPTVSIAEARRVSRVLNTAHIMGLNSMDESVYDASVLERGGSVSVLDMAYAYSVFATGGYMQGVDTDPIARNFRARNPVAVLRIESANGEVLWEYDATRKALSRTNILGEAFSYLITHILADGEARRQTLGINDSVFNVGRPVALMNAISSDSVNNWTIGYTPQRLVAVHMGRKDDVPMSLSTHALEGASTLWNALMRYAHERDALPIAGWARPNDVVEYTVCERSGMLPRPEVNCPRRNEIFLRQVPPYQTDTFWQAVTVNSQTRALATFNTPINLQVTEIYFVPPQLAMDWWKSNNLPLPPTDVDIASRPNVLKAVELFVPADFAYIGGSVDIRGSIDTTVQPLRSFQLAYGQGLNPTQWFNIGDLQTQFRAGASLGVWDTSGLDGLYTLQLTATFADNTRDTDFVQVTIDNQPPSIQLIAGEPNQAFVFPRDTRIPIIANVSDNLAIGRVEFYHNGQLLGIDSDYPYGFEFTIQRTGVETFTATVFDQVGNSASTEIQVTIARE